MQSSTVMQGGVGRLRGGVLSRALARLVVRLRRASLDEALAKGRDPWGSTPLMLRAAQLGTLGARAEVARRVEHLVTLAERREPASSYLLVRHDVVLAYREELLEIADRLRELAPIDVAVVAQLRMLVCDGHSPAYCGGRPPAGVGAVAARCASALHGAG
jgi:hypothetical protein